jgi:hypothetical protein
LKALWNLSFDEENRKKICDSEGLELLKEIAREDGEAGKNAKGAMFLFNLEEGKM